MQAQLKGSGIISFDASDFDSGEKVNYIEKDKTAANEELDPIKGTLQFTGNAIESDVVSGKIFYNDDIHTAKVGTMEFSSSSATKASDVEYGGIFYSDVYTPVQGTLRFTGNAVASQVESGHTFYNTDLHTKVNGTLKFTGNSNASDVEKGKTFYKDNVHQTVTGSLEFTGNANASDVQQNKTFYNKNIHQIVTGSLTFDGTANPADVTSGYTFYNNALRTIRTGTLAFSGNAQPSQVSSGSTFYNNALHTLRTGTLSWAGTASGNASNANVLSGKTYYTNSLTSKNTGSMPNRGAVAKSINSGQTYTIPNGYHNGNGKVTEPSPRDQTAVSTSGAGAAQIWSGKTAYVNGNIITGTGWTSAHNTASSSVNGTQVTLSWSYPSGKFITGVVIRYKRGRFSYPTSPTDGESFYSGTGKSATVWLPSSRNYYSISIFPYTKIGNNTYYYPSSSTTSAAQHIDIYTTCSGHCGDCDRCSGHSCGCDGACCEGACGF